MFLSGWISYHLSTNCKETVFLGIWLDNNLNFKHHINTLTCFFYTQTNISSWFTTEKELFQVIFLSFLDYEDVVNDKAAAATLKPLSAVDHSARRFITGDVFNTAASSVYYIPLNFELTCFLYLLTEWLVAPHSMSQNRVSCNVMLFFYTLE